MRNGLKEIVATKVERSLIRFYEALSKYIHSLLSFISLDPQYTYRNVAKE